MCKRMKFKAMPDFELFESTLSEKNIFQNLQIFGAHENLRDRLKRTFYYGRLPKSPCTSLPLTEATVELFAKAVPKGKLDILDADFAASVSKKACISPCSLMLALVYLERLRHKNPDYLQTVSSCDLFLVSMMVASKYLFDYGEEEEVFNDEWAEAANMEPAEVNSLEREFLAAMSWELFVKPATFFRMLENIESRIARTEGLKRGWLTYTDANILSDKVLLLKCWNILLEDVVKVILVSAIAYISALATLSISTTLSHKCYALITHPVLSVNYSPPINVSLDLLTLNEANFNVPSDCDRNRTDYKREIRLDEFFLGSLERMRTVFEGISVTRGQNDFWDTLQYAPTCCGAVNSYFL